jgi:hypothetical protein
MANVKRLTDRVKKIEKWIEINEDGPTLHNMDYLILSIRQANDMLKQEQQLYANFRNLAFEFIGQRDLADAWDEFVQEKQDAVQKQETESVPVRNEPETSEGVREEDAKEQETTE